MVSSIKAVAFTAVLLSATAARAELHFTFQTSEYEVEGVKGRQLVFADAGKQITYAPPRGWQYFGDPERLRLLPPSGQPGEALVSRIRLEVPQTFDDLTTKRLTDEAIAGLPGGSQRASVVSQQKNPLQIEGKETFLVIVHFDLYGTPQSRSVMFLNRGAEQIRFQLTCPQENFAKLQKQFLSSHFSWQNL